MIPTRSSFIIIIFSLAMIAALSYSHFAQRMLSLHYFPLNQTALNLQFHITTSHLWFEEMISGDRNIAIDSVWEYIDKAERYANAMLNGDEIDGLKIEPFGTPELRKDVKRTLNSIKAFRFIAEARWKNNLSSGVGSDSDQQFDDVFQSLLRYTSRVRDNLSHLIEAKKNTYFYTQAVIYIFVIIVSLVVTLLFHKHEKTQQKLMKNLLKQEQKVVDLLNSTAEAIIGLDLNGYCIFANPSAVKMFEFHHEEELLGKPFHQLLNYNDTIQTMDDKQSLKSCPLYETLRTGENHHVCAKLKNSLNSEHFYVEYWSYPVVSEHKMNGVVISFIDITQRKIIEDELYKAHHELEKRVKIRTAELSQANTQLHSEIIERRNIEKKLRHLSTHDPLTGLANRRYFNEYALEKLAQADRDNQQVHFLYMDLNKFKAINDDISHQAGDEVLIVIAKRLKAHIRKNELIARLGGDEFCMLIYGTQTTEEQKVLIERISSFCKQKIAFEQHQLQVGVSIGVASYPNDSKDFEELIHLADGRMYSAKRTSR